MACRIRQKWAYYVGKFLFHNLQPSLSHYNGEGMKHRRSDVPLESKTSAKIYGNNTKPTGKNADEVIIRKKFKTATTFNPVISY